MKTLIPADTAKLRAARVLKFLLETKLPRGEFVNSHMLECVAIALGFPDWNTMKAAIDKHPVLAAGLVSRLSSYEVAELANLTEWDGQGHELPFRQPKTKLGSRIKPGAILGEYEDMPLTTQLSDDTLIVGARKSALVRSLSSIVYEMYMEGLPVIWVTDRFSAVALEEAASEWAKHSQLGYELVTFAPNLSWNMVRAGSSPTLVMLQTTMLKGEQREQLLPVIASLMKDRGNHRRAHLVLDHAGLDPSDLVKQFFKSADGRRWSLWARVAPTSKFHASLRQLFSLRLVAGLAPDVEHDPSIDAMAPQMERDHHGLPNELAMFYGASSVIRYAPHPPMIRPKPVHAQVGVAWGKDAKGKKAAG